MQDSAAKLFIKNYADENFINDKVVLERAKEGISYRLAVMNIDVGGPEALQFPLVNEYKFHHIYRTGYFVKEPNGSIKMKYIDVVPKEIFIPA